MLMILNSKILFVILVVALIFCLYHNIDLHRTDLPPITITIAMILTIFLFLYSGFADSFNNQLTWENKLRKVANLILIFALLFSTFFVYVDGRRTYCFVNSTHQQINKLTFLSPRESCATFSYPSQLKIEHNLIAQSSDNKDIERKIYVLIDIEPYHGKEIYETFLSPDQFTNYITNTIDNKFKTTIAKYDSIDIPNEHFEINIENDLPNYIKPSTRLLISKKITVLK